jgi:hypothetical protein
MPNVRTSKPPLKRVPAGSSQGGRVARVPKRRTVARSAPFTDTDVDATLDGLKRSLEASVRQISRQAKTIDGALMAMTQIAARSRLLALNAVIEAARVGETGEGFAGVACEVKSLAAQTGTATEELSDRIRKIQETIKSAAGSIQASSTQLRAKVPGFPAVKIPAQ